MKKLSIQERIRIGILVVKHEYQLWHYDGAPPFFSYRDSGLDFNDSIALNTISCACVFLATRYYYVPAKESILLVTSVFAFCLAAEVAERILPTWLRPSRPLLYLFGVIRACTTNQTELLKKRDEILKAVASEKRQPSLLAE